MSNVSKEPAGSKRLIAALQQNWLAEMEGSATYRALAEREQDPMRRSTLIKLSEAEQRHAQRWLVCQRHRAMDRRHPQ